MGALGCVSSERVKSSDSTEVFTINLASSNSCLDEPRRDVESQFSKTDSNDKHSVWWTLGVDIPLLFLVGLLIALFELGALASRPGGFRCNDPALAHRFTGDTVSMAALVLSVLLLPAPVLFVTETWFARGAGGGAGGGWRRATRRALWLYRCYALGLFLNLGVIELLKVISGMPRPTFFDICNPDVVCEGSEFVSSFSCRPSERFSPWFQSDSYHSFPSGHTSLSVHCALFLAWYVQRRAFSWSRRVVMPVPVLQLALAAYAALCSLSRLSDHRHHWWDVAVGAGIGLASALYSALVLCGNFSRFSSRAREPPPPAGLRCATPADMIS